MTTTSHEAPTVCRAPRAAILCHFTAKCAHAAPTKEAGLGEVGLRLQPRAQLNTVDPGLKAGLSDWPDRVSPLTLLFLRISLHPRDL